MLENQFLETWLVDFTSCRPPGEVPQPLGLVARELRSGRVVRFQQGSLPSTPPYPVGPDCLFVTYDAPTALGCHLSLGWPLPERVLDLHAEFRCLTAGVLPPGDYDLGQALAHYGLAAGEGVDGLSKLLDALLPSISLPHALLRGRYSAAVARMEAVGVPIDVPALNRLRDGWCRVQDELIAQVDHEYGVFQNGKFNPRLWRQWVNRNGLPWPRLGPGLLDLSLDTFRDMAQAFPEVRPLKELRATLAVLKPFDLQVGPDGRNRCPLRPFATKTGRNAPSTTKFIFGPAVWLRGLIRPEPGMALAYVDFEQQEFGIGAALSGDEAMMQAYRSGDPYLAFAKQAGAVPADASKDTHREERDAFKACALGVQYGMGEKSLACRLGVPVSDAKDLLRLHRDTYPTYWRWSRKVEQQARRDGRLTAAYGWMLHVGADANPRSLRNFPLQANGAEMLRLACCVLTEKGVRVCAPVHDALLIEAPEKDIEGAVAACHEVMQAASEAVLEGFTLRAEAKVIRRPGRYTDGRGRDMWEKVFRLLERRASEGREEPVALAERTCNRGAT